MSGLRDILPPSISRPPRAWLVASAAILAATGATIAVLWWLGVVRQGDAGVYFDEWEAGTYASGALLLACAAVSGLLARRLQGRRAERFWWLATGGFVYLAYDDVFKVHERIDRWVHERLGLDPDHPVTDHLDDAIVLLYVVIALAVAWWHRRDLFGSPWFDLSFAAAIATGALMLAIDWTTDLQAALEESLKLVTEALLLIGLLGAWLDPELEERMGPAT